MSKFKRVITNWKVIFLLVALLLMVTAIHPVPSNSGVSIRGVAKDSAASLAGIQSPKPTIKPVARERILAMSNVPINSVKDYYDFIKTLKVNQTIQIKTNRQIYVATTKEDFITVALNETELKEVKETILVNKTVNGTIVPVNETITRTIVVNKTEKRYIGMEDIGLAVYNAPKTNVKKGLDLEGGTRVLLQPEKKLSPDEMDVLLENMKQRLNVYGLTDIVVREANDLSGNQYILIEIAGATKEEVKDLLARQGKFEAKIGNKTVFSGGKDITYVCRSANCAGIDPLSGCGMQPDGSWSCRFRFSITLSPESAARQAELTKGLDVISSDGSGEYLSERLILFLDDEEVDQLNIGADLKGRAVTDIEISGGGTGRTEQEAVYDSLKNMKRLQTILITGSLPVKLDMVKTDTISPVLGEGFIKNSWFMAVVAAVAVTIIVFIRFRKIEVVGPMVFTMLSEVVMLLGLSALISWNLDLAAIAGIIVAVGTGVDDQIVITDEIAIGERKLYNWKERFKRAFFIIFAAYFSTVVAMLPLMSAGAGLLKGFALITIAGVSIGVFITRPAYAAVVEILLKD